MYRWFDRTISLQKGDVNTACKGGLTGLSVYRKVTSTLPVRTISLQKGDVNTACNGGLTGLSVYRKVMSTLSARVV